MGRSGFIYFFVPIWELSRILFKTPPLERYHVVILVNLVFSSLTVWLVYSVTKKISRNTLIAYASAIILIFSKDFISLAGNTFTEPMMIFMIFLSYWCYLNAIDKKSISFFYLSAFLFGYAFEIKEAALLSILFFPALHFTRFRSKYFRAKNYFLFILIFIITGLMAPVYFYLIEGNNYVHHVIDVAEISKFNFADWQQTYTIMRHGFGILLFPLAGLIALLLRKKATESLILFSLIAPNIIFSIYGTRDERYFVFGYIALSVLTAYAFFYITQYARFILKIPPKYAFHCFSILLIILVAYNFAVFYRPLIKDNEYSKKLKSYGSQLIYNYPKNTVFILGEYSALMGGYYNPLSGSNNEVIWSGVTWPHKELSKVVAQYLSQRKMIIIDLDGFNGWWQYDKPDVLELMSLYKCKRVAGHFIELTNKSYTR